MKIYFQNGNVVVTPFDGTGLLDASGNLTFSNLGSNKIIQTIQIPVSSSSMLDDGGQQLQLQVSAIVLSLYAIQLASLFLRNRFI